MPAGIPVAHAAGGIDMPEGADFHASRCPTHGHAPGVLRRAIGVVAAGDHQCGKRQGSVGGEPNSLASPGNAGAPWSGTATRKAPRTWAIRCWLSSLIPPRNAQCATSRHERLCATRTTGPAHSSMDVSRACSQSARFGLSQSAGWNRWQPFWREAQSVCQCRGPELPIPGSITG